jgi:hypothetical protein
MQTASNNFATAMSAHSGVWLAPQVSTDWADDGYGGTGSIDDLTQVAGRIRVSQAFDDGMPSDVTYTSSSDPTSTATVDLSGRSGLGSKEYWSTFNTSSPVAAYERDVAPVTISPGAVTSGGPERVTVFTGRMSDTPVDGSSATLTAISATRQALSASVQPPPIWGDNFGLKATWPVSWSLAQCGVYTSPPPRPGCRAWLPMHGSCFPFLPATGYPLAGTGLTCTFDETTGTRLRPTFVAGPYVSGVFAAVNSSQVIHSQVKAIPLAAGSDLISQRASAGRVEFWVRADAADVNAAPGGSGSLGSPLSTVTVLGSSGASAGFVVGGIGPSRVPYVRVNDNAGHDTTFSAASAIPSDGQWRFVGFAWDVAAKKAWVNDNGTVTTTTLSSHVTSSLNATNDFDLFKVPVSAPRARAFLHTYLPVAEVQVTAGSQANPDNYPWLNDPAYQWTKGADIRPSQTDLVGLAELKAREAWEYIASFAQAELAQIRTTEADQFAYYPMSWLAEAAQQTPVDTLSTSTNLDGGLALTSDPSTIRNQVTVNYLASVVYGTTYPALATIHDDFSVVTLPVGVTTVTVSTDIATIYCDVFDDPFLMLDAAAVAAGGTPYRNYLCANTAADGTGTYADSTQVSARVTAFTASTVTVEITNLTGTVYYTVNNSTTPYMHLVGAALVTADASLSVQNDSSITKRGVRGLTIDLPAIQDSGTATSLASELLARLGNPRVSAKATVRGDPRRQPGDLVTIADPTGTRATGYWRLATVDHDINGADYTQDVTATQGLLVGVWDSSTWGNCIWGE